MHAISVSPFQFLVYTVSYVIGTQGWVLQALHAGGGKWIQARALEF